MSTKRIFPEPQNERPLPNRYTFKPTHKVTRRDGSTFEVNTTPEFIALWSQRLGWTVREVKQA